MKRCIILSLLAFPASLLVATASGGFFAAARQPVDDAETACGPLHQELIFSIRRKRKKIGEQSVRVYDCGEFTRAAIELRVTVRIAFAKIKSSQRIVEDWNDKRLLRLSSERTASLMGTTLINVSAIDTGWSVTAGDETAYTDKYLVSTAYWTAAAVNAGALLNIDNGEIINVASVKDDERGGYRLERDDGKTVLLHVDGQYVRRVELIDGDDTEIVFEAIAG